MSRGSHGPAPRARQSTLPEEVDGLRERGIPCQNCHTNIPYIADRVIVRPCGHILCNLCCLTSHVERGCTPHTCPVVGCNCFTHQLEYMRVGSSSIMISNRVVEDDQYIKHHLPTLWLKQQHQSEITETPENEGVVISCSKIWQRENGKLDVKTITSTFVLRHRESMPVQASNPNRALVEVGNVFSFMHGPLAETSYFNDIHELPVLSPREYLEMRCRLPQQRLLDRALFAVSTGKSEFNDELYLTPDNQDHQKQYLAAITSSDILLRTLRGNPGTPGHFQLMFGELLNWQRLTRDFRDLCSALNLAPSRKYTLKARAESV
jgi:hypothetical protein